jgi:hypothetical protein
MIVSVAAAEAMMVLLLWIALMRPGIPRIFRPLIALVGLSCAWGAWVVALLVPAPLWITVLAGGFFALSSAGLGVAIHLATREETREAGGGDTGGYRGLDPESPSGGGGDPQPEWWPDFERELAGYAAQQKQPAERVGSGL